MAIIEIVISIIESDIGHSQHQKDVTMSEIRLLESKTTSYDNQISKNITNLDKLFEIKIKILLCLSIWSTNIQYHRINCSMASYGLHVILQREYDILSDDFPVLIKVKVYKDPVKKVLKLFRQCGIMSFKEEWSYAHK